MKKLIITVLFVIIAAAGCQQKQEPKSQQQFPVHPSANPMQLAEEIRILQEAVKQEPGNVNAWIKLGNIMMDSSRFSEAINAYQKALEIDPENVDVRVDMGTCYRNSGNPEKAVQEYRKAVKIKPSHLNAHRNLGVVLAYDLKDRAEAIKEFEKYLELAPYAPDAVQIRQLINDLKGMK